MTVNNNPYLFIRHFYPKQLINKKSTRSTSTRAVLFMLTEFVCAKFIS